MRGLPHRFLCAAGILLAASCTAGTPAQEKSMELDPATAAYQKHGYNALPVEARLGPHRFLVPANYFRDQIGPDFQGSWELMLQWPDLEPLPPGERNGESSDTFGKRINISPRYVDRVPIETRLEVSTRPSHAKPGDLEYDDPRHRLDLMLAQSEQYGLTPYLVNQQLLRDYARRYEDELGVPTRITPVTYQDWFVRRDSDGRLRTLIRCDHEDEPGDESNPHCEHALVVPDLKVAVNISYRRDYLSDWERIEHKARQLIEQFRVDQ